MKYDPYHHSYELCPVIHPFEPCKDPQRNEPKATASARQDWENDFYEVLPIIKSSLTLDAKVARIKTIVEKLLQTARQEGWQKGVIDTKREALLQGFIFPKEIEAEATARERTRILTLLTSFPDSPVIQQVIELMNKK